MTGHRDDSDAPRDAHLLAALRHAPDRDAQPPRAVSERILAAARAAVRPAGPAWWQRATAWLAQPRLAASVGTLVAALLVGVMWSTREPPPTGERVVPAGADSAPSSAANAERDAAAAEPSLGRERPPATTERSRDDPASKVQRAPPRPPTAAPAPKALQKDKSAPKAQAAAPPGAAQVQTRPSAERAATAPPGPAPSPTAPASTADAAAGAAPPALMRRETAPAGESARVAELRNNAQRQQAADPLRALEASGTAGWTWHVAGVAGERERSHAAPQQALWAALQAATRGRWQRVAAQSPPLEPWARLSSQGRPHAVFWLADGALYLADAQGATWRAPVTPQQQRDWQQALAGW